MPECPSCAHQYEGDPDFCPECGEYLRWEPTGYQKPVEEPDPPTEPLDPPPPAGSTPPPAAPTPQAPPPTPTPPREQAPAAAPEPATVTLRLPGEDSYAEGALRAGVEPGGQTMILALVRNQSGIVENYDLAVDGLPDGWWTIQPNTVYLVPYGSRRGEFEQEVEVALHPPRSGEAESGDWEMRVVATPRSASEITSSAPATLEIGAYQQIEAELNPEKRNGRLDGTFELSVINRGNAPLDVTLSAVDTEEACEFIFREPAGSRAGALVEGVKDQGKAAGKAAGARAKGIARSSAQQAKDAANPLRGGARGPEAALRGAQYQVAAQARHMLRGGGMLRSIRNLFRRGTPTQAITGLTVPAGDRAEATLEVGPSTQLWIGRPKLHAFQATVQPVGDDTVAVPVGGTLNQKPWLPWWLLIVIPLLLLLGLFLWINRPERSIIPDLAALTDVQEAQAALEAEGLVLGDTAECIPGTPGAPPPDAAAGGARGPQPCPAPSDPTATQQVGSIVEQIPAAGEKVDAGTSVSIKLAVSDGTAEVPSVTGGTLADASAALRQAGFQAGKSINPPTDEATAVIQSQIPPAGTKEPLGAAIDLVFAPPNPAAGGGGAGAAAVPIPPPVPGQAAPGAEAGAGPEAGGPVQEDQAVEPPPPPEGVDPVAVPDVTGSSPTEAAQAVSDAGLMFEQVSVVEGAPGTVTGQDPAPETEVAPGSAVRVFVGGGTAPNVVFDSGGDIQVIDSEGIAQPPLIADPTVLESQPSFSSDGSLVVFRRGTADIGNPNLASSAEIWAAVPGDPASVRPLTNAGFGDRRPALSPDGLTVAFVSNRGTPVGDTDLCFTATNQAQAQPTCVVDPGTSVSRPTWAPGGNAIVVTASDAASPGQTELQLYTSQVPNSASAQTWAAIPALITDAFHGQDGGEQVLEAEFSPDGQVLAFSANWQDQTFKLHLAGFDPQAGVLSQPQVQVQVAACEIGWRPDGAELVVVQRDSFCNDRGQVVRIDPRDPAAQKALTDVGANSDNPAFAPVAPAPFGG